MARHGLESSDNHLIFRKKRPISFAKPTSWNLPIIYRQFREIYRWRQSPSITGAPEYPQNIRNWWRGSPQREVSDG